MKVVLFHKHCNDGLFAAYAAWKKFGNDALYIPVNYKPIQDLEAQEALNYIFSEKTGESIDPIGNSKFKVTDVTPDMYGEIELYVVDYSFPVEHFNYHATVFKSILVLDHHKAAIDNYCEAFPNYWTTGTWKEIRPFENCNLIFSKHESGAKLAWMYFHPDEVIPDVIELVSDRDLWKFKLEYTRAFHAGIRSINEQNFEKLDMLIRFSLDHILTIGSHHEKEVKERIAAVSKANVKFINISIDGTDHSSAIINSYPDIVSDLCASIIKEHGVSAVIAYNVYGDGNVGCSIRSNNLIALPVAKRCGGGGHDDSAGFGITVERLTNILTKGILEV